MLKLDALRIRASIRAVVVNGFTRPRPGPLQLLKVLEVENSFYPAAAHDLKS